MIKTAYLSDDRVYRYVLWRIWDDAKPMINFIGLNPSTANETVDDPTTRRCIGYAKDWGGGSLTMTNLFAFRGKNPKDMKAAKDPVGILNDVVLLGQAMRSSISIAAWGSDGNYLDRDKEVLKLLNNIHRPLKCLALTKNGMPRHPLYLKKDLKPFVYINTAKGEG